MPATAFPLLETSNLLLRQIVAGDQETIFHGLSDPDVIQYYGVRYSSLDAAREQMKFYSDLERTGQGTWWAVCSKGNNKFYGAAGLNNLVKEHRKAEIGFWLFPEFWGKGILTEAIPRICNHGFRELDLHRIEALVETENTRSVRLLAKLGFNHEGTMQECERKDNRFISLAIYARFQPYDHV